LAGWQNRILVTENTVPRAAEDAGPPADVAARIAAQTLAKRGVDYAGEVRRLLDAALAVIGERGTTSAARVADIVAEAGLSNEAFYRHFPSKDALVAALLEDGTLRLASYVAHQMDKESAPDRKVRRWVEGVLSQTDERVAAVSVAVLWNGSSVGTGLNAGRHNAGVPLATLLHEPFRALGSPTPDLHASLVAHATLGKLSDYLWAGERPTRDEIDQITDFCVSVATAQKKRR
jgi:AcrR family transcriptional regulator